MGDDDPFLWLVFLLKKTKAKQVNLFLGKETKGLGVLLVLSRNIILLVNPFGKKAAMTL